MSKRRHNEIEPESSEHHAHAESQEHKEHAEHHEHKEHAEHHEKGVRKPSDMKFYAGFVVVAAVFFVLGFLVNSTGVGNSGVNAGDQLIFISPPGCANCSSLEPLAKQVASSLKIPYSKTGFGQQMTTPGMVLVYNGSFMGAMGFDSEYSLKSNVCLVTKNSEVCGEAQKLTPPADSQQQQPAATDIPKAAKTNVKFFTMAYCPYGNQAESGLIPVYNLLKDKVDWEPHYVIYANYGGGGPDYCMNNGSYCSMHGIQELHEDIRELCIWKYETHDKFFNFLADVNSACTAQNVDTCWEAVAKKYSINTDKIKQCQADEGVALVKAEYELDQEFGVQGSPSVFINDAQYQGGRTPDNYKTSICAGFNSPPSECSQTLSGGGTASNTAAGGCG
jgi:hypothetical protein